MNDKSYRIVRLEADNLKRLVAVQVSPDGNLIEVTGKNGQGKSSLLDAIYYALAGTSDIPATPIRKGEQSARIHLDLGALKVTRRFAAKEDGGYTTSLTVENEDKARYSSPQSILDALIGELAFDPLEFTRMKPKEQFDALRRFVPDFDFDMAARERQRVFDERTAVNRQAKDLKSQVAGMSVPADTPDEEIDVSALADELQKVGEHNAEIETRRANRERVADEAVRFRAEADSLTQQAADYRRLADECDAKASELHEKADASDKRLSEAGPLPDPKDPSEIRAKIDQANATNTRVRDKKRLDDLIQKAKATEAEADRLTKAIEQIDAEKAAAIASAKMPVEGIGFADGYVTLNGLPFEQASSAEQLRASIAIAMAANPRLRVLIVKDGALLDDESMMVVAEMAEANDCQIWIESVASGRPSALVIEDGRVRGEAIAEAAA